MAKKIEEEKVDMTGLDQAADRKDAEYDLVTALLESAGFKTSDDNITAVDIKRNGKYMFTVHIHPISEADARFARKKAAIMMPNPNNKKLPPIEKDMDQAKFNSWLIYLGTTEEDQEKIWGNSTIMQKYALSFPYESIDVLLMLGEKQRIADLILEISGMGDEEEENVDEESFQ